MWMFDFFFFSNQILNSMCYNGPTESVLLSHVTLTVRDQFCLICPYAVKYFSVLWLVCTVVPEKLNQRRKTNLAWGFACILLQQGRSCWLWPVWRKRQILSVRRQEVTRRDIIVCPTIVRLLMGPFLTEREAFLSSWYLAPTLKSVLLLPAVQARWTAVSALLFTFW